MMKQTPRPHALICGLTAALAVSSSGVALARQAAPTAKPATPQFPPPADFAGVAGSPAELASIAALCGPNRNARDGYAPSPAFAGQTKAPLVAGTQGYVVEQVAKIERPFGMAFLPTGKMLITFRNGGMRMVGQDGVVSEPLENVPQILNPRIGAGMFDVILDRDFARNRTIYFTYYTKGPEDTVGLGRVASARLSRDEKRLEDVKVLRAGADILPRRIVQRRDGTLLIASAGDLGDVGSSPQDLSSQSGKVLRINTDGSIPKDNPYLSDLKANPAVWAIGFRDIHAAVIHPRTGDLWTAENEPMGGDELNVIRPGKNYGFPVISYGRQNSGALIDGGKTAEAGMEQPAYYWNPSFAPSGMAIYTGSAFKGWKGNVFIGGMSGQQLVRIVMNGERVVGEEKLLMDRCQRFKVVQQGTDGFLYVLTDEPAPRQNEILRLRPAATPPIPRMPPAAPAS